MVIFSDIFIHIHNVPILAAGKLDYNTFSHAVSYVLLESNICMCGWLRS